MVRSQEPENIIGPRSVARPIAPAEANPLRSPAEGV